jgi:hypothetical protein
MKMHEIMRLNNFADYCISVKLSTVQQDFALEQELLHDVQE